MTARETAIAIVGGACNDVCMVTSPTSATMVGRDAELTSLLAAFGRSTSGAPQAVLVSGEAGIGKTRLLRVFGDEVAARANVLVGQCINLGDTPTPYGPLVAILRGVVDGLGADAALSVAGPGRDALLLLLPELGDGPVDWSEVSASRLHEVVAVLIEEYARRAPLVLMIEDLHWADASTLTMLRFLLRAITDSRLLLVLSFRREDVRRGDPVRAFIAEGEQARLLDRVELERLDRSEVRDLAELILGRAIDEDSLSSVFDRAEGVPFFVEELVCCSGGRMPDTLRDLMLTRYDQLDETAQRVVRVLSGSEGWLPHPLLSAVADMPDDELDAAIRSAVQANIVTVDGEAYCFRHALLREAVHDELLPGERGRLHLAFATALESHPDLAPSPAAIAYHWHAAHDTRRALVASVRAMEDAKTSYAYATASRLGELAIELWDSVPDADELTGTTKVKLLARVGSALRNAGDGERALTTVNAALAEAEQVSPPPEILVRLLRDKAQYVANLGRPGSVELLIDALAMMSDTDADDNSQHVKDERLRANLLNTLAGRYMVGGLLHEAIVTARTAFTVAEATGNEAEMSIAANLSGMSRGQLGDVSAALADLEIAREHAIDGNSQLRYSVNFSDLMMNIGRFREAVDIAEAGYARAKELGVERSSGTMLLHNIVDPLLQLGEIDRAEKLIEQSLAMSTHSAFLSYTRKTKIRALLWRGDVATAQRLAREWLPGIRSNGAVDHQVWYAVGDVEATLAAAQGEWAAAWHTMRAMLDHTGPIMYGFHRSRLLDAAAIVARLRVAPGPLTLDDVEQAATAVREAWVAVPDPMRTATWTTVIDALLLPPGPDSRDPLSAAVEAAEDESVPALIRPLVSLQLARALVAAGERAAAQQRIENAAHAASVLSHVGLQREVADFAAAAGLAAGGQTDAAVLTARERQVLDLIAEGLSNRQIGERLFISAKTASVHVSAILRKLGVSTRTEAAVAAQQIAR